MTGSSAGIADVPPRFCRASRAFVRTQIADREQYRPACEAFAEGDKQAARRGRDRVATVQRGDPMIRVLILPGVGLFGAGIALVRR